MTAPGGLRHFLEIDDLTPLELRAVLDAATSPSPLPVLAGKGAALMFEKPSARTRNATEMAVVQLGGHPISMRGEEIGIDTRESAEDVARTLSCYHAVIAARVHDHTHLERMASVATVPVLNLLSDRGHPCQALADLLTLEGHFGYLAGLTVAYVGDWNNVALSLGLALGAVGARLRLACPPDYAPDSGAIDRLRGAGAEPFVSHRAEEAVAGANAVYTDVWVSMGQEAEADARRRAFEGFTVDLPLLREAAPGAVFLHCLPAHRGEEVAGEVIDNPASLVWPQAVNRLHAARGAFIWLLSQGQAWST